MENGRYKMQYLDTTYETLTVLGRRDQEKPNVFLAQHKGNGKIVVKKYVDAHVLPVYEKIKNMTDIHLEKIYDYAADDANGVVIAEYISGMTLSEWMQNGLATEMTARAMVCDLLQVLKVIHAQKIVHRDINPDNIMISGDGVLKLIDFGIARQKKEEQFHDTTILGTVGYAAPEQFGFFQTDERSDIYAVGVLLNKLLTGFFPGERMYEKEPLRGVIQHCTAMDINQRFQNVNEVLTAMGGQQNLRETVQAKSVKMEKRDYHMTIPWLPGFRAGAIWKNIIATVGYILMLFYTILSVYECARSLQACLLEIIAVGLYVWAATLLAFNIGNWDRKIWPFKKWSIPVMTVIRVFLWLMLFYFGARLEQYVRYDLLGFARP